MGGQRIIVWLVWYCGVDSSTSPLFRLLHCFCPPQLAEHISHAIFIVFKVVRSVMGQSSM